MATIGSEEAQILQKYDQKLDSLKLQFQLPAWPAINKAREIGLSATWLDNPTCGDLSKPTSCFWNSHHFQTFATLYLL